MFHRISHAATPIVAGVLMSVAFGVLAQGPAPAKWTPEVMIKYKRLLGTAISPDGKWVAYTVSEPLLEGEKSEYRSHIFLAGADGKTDFQLLSRRRNASKPLPSARA